MLISAKSGKYPKAFDGPRMGRPGSACPAWRTRPITKNALKLSIPLANIGTTTEGRPWPGWLGAVGFTLLSVGLLYGQEIPPERPRSRPPSELTGWADWEKAQEMLKRLPVPPA